MGITNTWKWISYLGVTDEMPVYFQKATILYNQIIRILLFFLLAGIILLFQTEELQKVGWYLLALYPFLGITLILNYKGKVHVSVLLLSTLVPLYILWVSAFTKSMGIGLNVLFYLTPRAAILIFTLVPLLIIGFYKLRYAVFSMSVGVISFVLFDYVHNLAGATIDKADFISAHYPFYVLMLAVLFVVMVLIIVFLQRISSQYENLVAKQKEEIATQRDYVTSQRDQIKRQNDTLMESLQYARRIQHAILPDSQAVKTDMPEYFVFYQPKSVVSGDFYWLSDREDYSILVAADCTGHGVPGAFVSMLGITFLKEVIDKQGASMNAAEVLNELRDKIKDALNQKGNPEEAKDGMDMALCVLNKQNNALQYAGAHNPLYLIRDNELYTYKADRMPVAVHRKEKAFSNHVISIQPGDSFYMFSDGFVDQIGEEKNEKYKTRRFKELLKNIHQENLAQQRELLREELNSWKGNREQIDDILIIGFSFA